MTDMECFIELYKSFGVELIAEPTTYVNRPETTYVITLHGDTQPKFGGYSGFHSTVEFDINGKFLIQEFWE